ncbi:hypothetical protein [Candidatus Nitrotoga fabula]|uniref:Uncharacterized protein n=1 Tax=Candidatus Nitrotoga fabula TaxID=2182327 RepID=A0A916BDD3_9PROT|nr:hypothetical protein [Candidatus Nitrotoga fabula]CAE6702485.1 hypothetical protein NTGZN8_160001 [Candidatus Nitrotoga fabula]
MLRVYNLIETLALHLGGWKNEKRREEEYGVTITQVVRLKDKSGLLFQS